MTMLDTIGEDAWAGYRRAIDFDSDDDPKPAVQELTEAEPATV